MASYYIAVSVIAEAAFDVATAVTGDFIHHGFRHVREAASAVGRL